jgi:hypothetical protein
LLYEREEHTLFVANVLFQNRAELLQEADGPLPRLYVGSAAPDRHMIRQDSHDRFLLGGCDPFVCRQEHLLFDLEVAVSVFSPEIEKLGCPRFTVGLFGTAKPLGDEQRLVVIPGEPTQCLSALHGGIGRFLPVGCISCK